MIPRTVFVLISLCNLAYGFFMVKRGGQSVQTCVRSCSMLSAGKSTTLGWTLFPAMWCWMPLDLWLRSRFMNEGKMFLHIASLGLPLITDSSEGCFWSKRTYIIPLWTMQFLFHVSCKGSFTWLQVQFWRERYWWWGLLKQAGWWVCSRQRKKQMCYLVNRPGQLEARVDKPESDACRNWVFSYSDLTVH